MEKTKNYNLRNRQFWSETHTNTSNCEERKRGEVTTEQNLAVFMEQLGRLHLLPTQPEAMQNEIKTLIGAVTDMAEYVDFTEMEVGRVKEIVKAKAENEEIETF